MKKLAFILTFLGGIATAAAITITKEHIVSRALTAGQTTTLDNFISAQLCPDTNSGLGLTAGQVCVPTDAKQLHFIRNGASWNVTAIFEKAGTLSFP